MAHFSLHVRMSIYVVVLGGLVLLHIYNMMMDRARVCVKKGRSYTYISYLYLRMYEMFWIGQKKMK